ncbi:RagB/SusD family nutrient uptake outer membrane protein [Gelidibacter salicanalis]|uniref:RagB/SusD family nutrient uptake outer membrane protein n=1 Tax=Gelidibacter salicanalis TaxID=291193 RepID=A0A934KZ64_9FLAO|nr:RagB/SusD family nutrient uptake outer membrane protein [Gelidibacter salicanalis]MBJ7882115.1 RagB/SusD family nutrient uptake outer membrane protein [Gelidibacter salicanalis]
MKNKFILLMSILVLGSCSNDFTDLAPISNRNEADFYNTENDFISAINASYAGLQKKGVYGRGYWTMFEMRSDNTDQGPDATGLARVYTEINAFTEDPLNEQITAAWTDSYSIIANCNVILERIDNVTMNTDVKQRIIGEALFLRSLMYYHLAIAYANIPLQLTPFSVGDELTQVDANTVLTQISGDLEMAEDNLAVSYSGGDKGRATKGAAATLMAKVLLTLNKKSEAEVVLRRIKSSYGYGLLNDYANLWGAANENNKESIFEVEFISGGIGQGSSFTNDFSPSAFLQTGQGFGRNRPTASLSNAYENGDLRFAPSMGTTYLNAAGATVEANYIRKYESDPPTENDSDINFVVFRYADVLLMLAEAIGESNEAYDLINEVRDRAGLAPIDASTSSTFEDKLLKERRVELAFENHRWPDLKRFGVAATKVNEAESFIPQSSVRSLFYIPQREMDLNTKFVQNTN